MRANLSSYSTEPFSVNGFATLWFASLLDFLALRRLVVDLLAELAPAVVSVAQLAPGNSFARLLCCPAQAERGRKKRRSRSAKLTTPRERVCRQGANQRVALRFW